METFQVMVVAKVLLGVPVPQNPMDFLGVFFFEKRKLEKSKVAFWGVGEEEKHLWDRCVAGAAASHTTCPYWRVFWRGASWPGEGGSHYSRKTGSGLSLLAQLSSLDRCGADQRGRNALKVSGSVTWLEGNMKLGREREAAELSKEARLEQGRWNYFYCSYK